MGLSPKYVARLAVLHEAVKRGKVAPDSDAADEYQRLITAQQAGEDPSEEKPDVPAPPAGIGVSLKRASVIDLGRFWRQSPRTISNWKQRRIALRDPDKFLVSFTRAFPGREVPPVVMQILADWERGQKNGAAHAPLAPRKIPEKAIGFTQAHRRMLEEEARIHAEMVEAREAGNLIEAQMLRKEWTRLGAALGSADTRQIRNALERGDLVARIDVEREFETLIGRLPDVLRAGLRDIRMKLDGAPPLAVWERDVDQMLDEFFDDFPVRLLSALSRR